MATWSYLHYPATLGRNSPCLRAIYLHALGIPTQDRDPQALGAAASFLLLEKHLRESPGHTFIMRETQLSLFTEMYPGKSPWHVSASRKHIDHRINRQPLFCPLIQISCAGTHPGTDDLLHLEMSIYTQILDWDSLVRDNSTLNQGLK